jgi:hypothetical protein
LAENGPSISVPAVFGIFGPDKIATLPFLTIFQFLTLVRGHCQHATTTGWRKSMAVADGLGAALLQIAAITPVTA